MFYVHPLLKRLAENNIRRIKVVVELQDRVLCIAATDKSIRKCKRVGLSKQDVTPLLEIVNKFYDISKTYRNYHYPFTNKWIVVITPTSNQITIREEGGHKPILTRHVHADGKCYWSNPKALDTLAETVNSITYGIKTALSKLVKPSDDPKSSNYPKSPLFSQRIGRLNTTSKVQTPNADPSDSPAIMRGLGGDHSGYSIGLDGTIRHFDATTGVSRELTKDEVKDM